MIIDRLRKDASFIRVLTRAGGWHKAYLIDEVEVQKISATMLGAAERIEALEARATPALPQAEHDLEDVRCQCCGYMTYHSEHMGCIRSAYKQALPQVPEGMAIVPVEGFKIEAGSEAYQEIIVTAADGGQQIFWPEDAAHGLMKAMLAAKEKGE